ncbi:Helix-turn-helix domain-containing protein OS=Streptomyces tendae OX=1932 GN=GUR47_38420 PE=4 SV=1 [Streptomyces tendae]
MAFPPHPPEEVTTSSPYPLTDPQGSLPSQREEGEGGFASKDLHAAESFLQQLRPPHHMGAASARKYAPLLLGAMAAQGWPSIFEVDHTVLAREVTRDPQGFKRPSSLVPTRIRDLPRYAIVTGVSASHGQGTGAERCPEHPARYRRGCVECALTVPV